MERRGNSQLCLNESTEEKKKTAEKLRGREPEKMRILGSGWMGLMPRTKTGHHEEKSKQRKFCKS